VFETITAAAYSVRVSELYSWRTSLDTAEPWWIIGWFSMCNFFCATF